MFMHTPRLGAVLTSVIVAVLLVPTASIAGSVPSYDFAAPIFGLATAADGSLLVADYGAGVVELRKDAGSLIAELPAVTDVAPVGRGDMFAVTGAGEADTAWKLFRVSHGGLQEIADLLAFEIDVNPDGGEIDSNPFDVAALSGGQALVADAGGNDLLIIDQRGKVDWVATFPDQLVSTDNVKKLAGCPTPPEGFEEICALPEMIPAQAVATSVAIGPDGAYYVGELKGFPAPTGVSRVWRIERGALHADCATSPACTVVADGFTSIVDLTFGPDGALYVVEIDEASWAAVEFGLGGVGGTVNRCDSSTWTCTEMVTGLPIPIAATVGRDGTVYAAILALVPGGAQVIVIDSTAPIASIVLTPSAPQILTSCSDTFDFTATALDADNTPVENVVIYFTLVATGNPDAVAAFFNPSNGVTDASGNVMTTMILDQASCNANCSGVKDCSTQIRAGDQGGLIFSNLVQIVDAIP